MPRIPRKILEAVIYLFPDEESAKRGSPNGGTGFLVGMPVKDLSGQYFVYAVTNWHVALGEGCSTIRINKHDGGTEIFSFEPDEWIGSKKYDIAIIPLENLDEKIHKVSVIPTTMFATRDVVSDCGISLGDDVYMIGRFIDHDGTKINVPSARFGNISIMPTFLPQGMHFGPAETYCIDLHSRTGYSGSPVFMYRTFTSDLEGDPIEKQRFIPGSSLQLLPDLLHKFLGIHFAQFPEIFRLTAADSAQIQTHEGRVPLLTGAQINGLSGMTCVLPAWAVLECLDDPKLRKERNCALEALEQTEENASDPNE
ncbi:trypsin-like peptidase domain-containing protein [Roseicella sp. DB1501]|uniref:trypsin-like peptidase domain-containing protein n=1 Tax=Roseicella sp. DB1501 TaxID=2730925 RepID=UPI00149322CD|nr:trypsin-like peptidase domain-containing protein [Roseicella sp. DB1501]